MIAKIICYLFHRPNQCIVRPKNPRANQLNKKFVCGFPLDFNILIKSDNFDQYYIDQNEFIRDWEIVEYLGELEFRYDKGIVKTKFNGKPVKYYS
jgi:hypothetical protein